MRTLIIKKDNYLDYIDTSERSGWQYNRYAKEVIGLLPKQLKRLCSIAPEFTHQPELALVPMTGSEHDYHNANGFAKLLVYKSDYFCDDSGSCVVRLCDTWFGLDGNKFGDDIDRVYIDIESFGIKRATEARIKKLCGLASYA